MANKKQSKNPMQYRVRSASGKINRYFRKRESAEAYYNKVVEEKADDVIIFEDIFANTIIDSYYNQESVPTPVVDDNPCLLCGSQRCSADEEAKSMCSKYSKPKETTLSNTSSTPYVYHYKDGVLTREKLEDKKPENKFIKFIKKLFKKG